MENTDLPQDFEVFTRYVREQLNGNGKLSLEESVHEFREYQRELAEVREKLREAEESSARGESGPFDREGTKRAVRERLAEHGITD